MVEVDPIVLAAGTAAIAILGVVACAQSRSKNNKKEKRSNDDENDENNENKQQQSKENKNNKDKKKKEKKENKTETPVATPAPIVQPVVKEQVKEVAPTTTTSTATTTTSSKQTKQSKAKNVAPEPTPAPVVATPPAPAPQAPVSSAAPQTTKATGKSGKGNKVVETPVTTPAPAPQPVVQPPPAAAAPSSSSSKKAQAKATTVSTPAPPAPAPQAPVSAPEPTQESTDATGDKKKKAKETPEQKAARLERQKKRKEEQAAANAESIVDNTLAVERVEFITRAPVNDGWEVVVGKPKTKKNQANNNSTTNGSSTATSSDAPVSSTPEQQSSKLTVDAKKIGIIIGPKGVTLRAIQDLTDATITMPKDRETAATSASITIAGSPDAVQNASNIIIELCTKGYSTKLESENFQESHISVHNQYLSEIIGKNGASIRALQDKLGVRITIPPTNSKDTTDTVKIGIAGDRENITRTKEVIREIMTYYHSPITHPGYVHASLDIPTRFYNNIIGTRGGEIRHIQNNFKVAVHIPSSTTLNQTLLVVGENSHNVDNAVRYIQKIVQQVTTDEINNAVVAETWDEQTKLQNADDNDDQWISQYMYNRNPNKTVDLMNALNVPISLPTAESNAWKIADSADGW